MTGDHVATRERSLRRNRWYGLVARILASFFGLLSTLLMVRYLGSALYGIWLVLGTIPGWLALLELGTGPVLRNRVAASNATGDCREMRREVSSVFMLLFSISGICVAVYLLVMPMLPLEWLLRLDTEFSAEETQQIKQVTNLLVILSLLSVPLGVATHVIFGLQRTYQVELTALLSSVVALVGLIIISWALPPGNFLLTVGWVGAVPQICSAGLFVWVFLRMYRWLRPQIREGLRYALHMISRQHLYFSGQHLASLVAPLGENFIVLHLLSSHVVSQVGIIQRWYIPLGIVHSTVMQPLHPAYAEAVHRGDMAWAGTTVRRFTRRSLILVGFGGLVLLLFQASYVRLIGHGLIDNYSVLGAMALVRILQQTWTGSWGIFLYAIGRVGPMTLYNWVGAILYVPLALYLGGKFGSVGVMAGAILAYLPLAVSNWWEAWQALKWRLPLDRNGQQNEAV